MNESTDSFRSRSPSIRYQPLQLDLESDMESRRKLFRQKQLKKLCWAGSLGFFGFLMLMVGLNWYTINRKGFSAFLMVGFLMFVPGAYGVYEVCTSIQLKDCCLVYERQFYRFSLQVVGTLNGWSGFEQLNDGNDGDEDSWTFTL